MKAGAFGFNSFEGVLGTLGAKTAALGSRGLDDGILKYDSGKYDSWKDSRKDPTNK